MTGYSDNETVNKMVALLDCIDDLVALNEIEEYIQYRTEKLIREAKDLTPR
jgi:hypothetical protein